MAINARGHGWRIDKEDAGAMAFTSLSVRRIFKRPRCNRLVRIARLADLRFAGCPFVRREISSHALPGGIERSGHRFCVAIRRPICPARETLTSISGFLVSLRLTVSFDGKAGEVRSGTPASGAVTTAGAQRVSVGDRAFASDLRNPALARSVADGPTQLLVPSGKYQREVRIDRPARHRFPHLEPLAGAPQQIDAILTRIA